MIKVRLTKKARVSIDFPSQLLLAEIGKAAAEAIRARVTGQNVDADGKPYPTTLHGGKKLGWVTRLDDPRFPPTSRDVSQPSNRGEDPKTGAPVVQKGRPKFRKFFGGYGVAKAAAGAPLRNDGKLSGAMWASLRVTVSTRGKGRSVAIGFSGTDKQGANRVTNQQKADAWERRDAEGHRSTAHDLLLMALSDAELEDARDSALAATRLLLD